MNTPAPAEEKPKRAIRQRDLSLPLDILTPAQREAIIRLVRYRYMTVRQFVACGVAKHENTMRDRVLYRLVHGAHPLLQYQDYFAEPANKRRAFVYALSAHGAKMAADLTETEVENIRYPIGGIKYVNEYAHREAYIDICIALDNWAAEEEGREVLSLSHYFDKTGANRNSARKALYGPLRSVNRIDLPDNMDPVEPDGIFFVDTGEKRRAMALEISNKTSTKEIVEKLLKLTHAVKTGVISKHLGHDKANFVLAVSMTPGASALVRKRVVEAKGFAEFETLFLFNDMEAIARDGFGKGWVYANGTDAAGVLG